MGPVQRSVLTRAEGRRRANHLRMTAERMEP